MAPGTANTEQEQGTMRSSGLTTAPDAHGEKWDLRLRITVAILCGALFLDAMDVSSVNVALPTIGSHLRMSASSLQWVVSGYVLGYGGVLPLRGGGAAALARRGALFALP